MDRPDPQPKHRQVLQPIGRLLLVTQLFALLLMGGGGTMLFLTARDFHRASLWVEHTQKVLDDIAELRINLLRGGLALRNYALVPDPETLHRVRDANKAAILGAEHLQTLLSDDPTQSELAFTLQSEAAEVVGWTRSIIVIAERDGPQALQASLRFRAQRDAAKDLRAALSALENAERRLMEQRSKERALEYSRLQKIAAAAALSLAVFLTWSIAYAAVLFRRGRASIHHLSSSAERDPLTGLLNRRALEEKFASLAAAPLTLVAFDLDDFKPVNDRHGHHGGDEVLRVTARRLERECRDHDLIARVGGDEFVIVLTGVSEAGTAAQVCRRLSEALSAPIALEGQDVRIGASIGYAVSTGDHALAALIAAADAAAYEEKRRRKSQRMTQDAAGQ